MGIISYSVLYKERLEHSRGHTTPFEHLVTITTCTCECVRVCVSREFALERLTHVCAIIRDGTKPPR